MITDLMGTAYQYLYQTTGSDLTPVACFAIVLVLLSLAVGHLVMMLLSRVRPVEATE